MIAASKRTGSVFTVHQNRRWDEDFRVAEKIAKSGQLGRVFAIQSRVHGSRGIPGDWRNTKAQGGGMVLDWGVHLLDQMNMMMGKMPVSVYATLSNVTNEEVEMCIRDRRNTAQKSHARFLPEDTPDVFIFDLAEGKTARCV